MNKRRIDPQQKIDEVWKAARRLFVARGYFNVSIPDIVKASGVSTGAIYHHFKNKETLASFIHQRTLGDFQEMLAERIAGRNGTYEKLKAFAELVLDIAESDPEMMEYMLFMKRAEFLKDTPPICSTVPFRWVQQTVAKGIEQGEVREGDYFLSSVSFTGVILRAVQLRLEGMIQTPLSESSGELIANAWASIKA